MFGNETPASSSTIACGQQKVKGGNGSINASTNASINGLDHPPEPRSGLCPELLADFRIPKPPGCSQGAQRAVFCAVRVADFLAEGAGWGASPGRGGELGRTATHEVVSRVTRHRGGITRNDCGYSTGVNRRASL